MIFSKGNLSVGRVASDNPHDAGINCIRLNADGSTVAANQRVVMAVGPVDSGRVHFPDVGEHSTPAPSGTSIPLDLLDKALKIIPKDRQYVALTKCRDLRKIELTTADMRHTQRVEGYAKTEPFLDWRGLFRKVKGVGGPRICLNRQDLLQLLTALEEACPDKGGQNPIFIEINPDSTGLILRCVNRETGQRAIGGMGAYRTGGDWLPADKWETEVFQVEVKIRKVITK